MQQIDSKNDSVQFMFDQAIAMLDNNDKQHDTIGIIGKYDIGWQQTSSRWKYDKYDSKLPGANMGPIWGRQDPDGPHVGPMNFAIWEVCWFWILNSHWTGVQKSY